MKDTVFSTYYFVISYGAYLDLGVPDCLKREGIFVDSLGSVMAVLVYEVKSFWYFYTFERRSIMPMLGQSHLETFLNECCK